jgi:hypothetical protein
MEKLYFVRHVENLLSHSSVLKLQNVQAEAAVRLKVSAV